MTLVFNGQLFVIPRHEGRSFLRDGKSFWGSHGKKHALFATYNTANAVNFDFDNEFIRKECCVALSKLVFLFSPTNCDMRKKNCFCAKSGKNLGAEKRSFSTGYVGEMTIVEHEIVFVVEGTFRIGSTTDPTLQRTLTAGEFVYIPMGVKVACHAIDQSLLLCVRVIEDVRECDLFRIDKSQDLDEDRPRAIYTLNATPIIKSFTKSLIEVIDSGMRCMNYMSTKASELVLLLHYCYTSEECARFFAPVVTSDMDFSEFVRTRYLEFRSVREMATELKMTTKTFARKFKSTFGENPLQWIERERAQKIYFAIC